MQYTVGIVTLGCDKNRVDSEKIASALKANGYILTAELDTADVIIINTCAFLESAREESFGNISKYIKYKQHNLKLLVVMGCLTSYKTIKLREQFPEVDLFLPVAENANIVKHLNKLLTSDERIKEFTSRLISTPSHYAYLKIADGCNNFCSYCLIPYLRGRYRSEPIEKLVEEAKRLAKIGVKELILIAQDVTNYGVDLYKSHKLVELIRELSQVRGIKYIRLHYCYPDEIDDELIAEIKNNKKVVKYLDIPIQHISDNVLKNMRRRTSKKNIIDTISRLKSEIPSITLRTTIMVGFPGETKDDFKELCEFLKLGLIDHIGFFAYSREEGTRSYKLPDQLSIRVKNKRLKIVEKLQSKIMKDAHNRLINSVLDAIIDEEVDEYYIARPLGSSPDVDPIIYVQKKDQIKVGLVAKVRLTELYKYDFIGELV